MFHVIKRGPNLSVIEADMIMPTAFESRDAAAAHADQLRTILALPTVGSSPKRGPKGQRVVCHQTNTVYGSIKEAAAALNVTASAISQHLHTPLRYRYVNQRYTFERVA